MLSNDARVEPVPTVRRSRVHMRVEPIHGLMSIQHRTKMQYFPCYVMDVDVFFDVYEDPSSTFKSWGSLLRENKIRKVRVTQESVGEHDDRSTKTDSKRNVLFISHEWTAKHHPDPSGKQLRVLYDTLKKLSTGSYEYPTCSGAVTVWKRLKIRKKTMAQWKEYLRSASLWIDYQSVPQMSDVKPDAEEKIRQKHAVAVDAAIKSIPSYISAADMFVALTPRVKVAHRTTCASYSTWRSRGWCTFEMFCAKMSPKDIDKPLLHITASESVPYFLSNYHDMSRQRVGYGSFTCCEMNHANDDVCDRDRLYPVMQSLLNEKIFALFHGPNRNILTARYFHVMSSHWLIGMTSSSSTGVEPVGVRHLKTVSELKRVLLWQGRIDDDAGRASGWTLLKFACVGGCTDVVREILESEAYEESPLRRSYPELALKSGITNFFFAVLSGDPDLVNILLRHGANPGSSTFKIPLALITHEPLPLKGLQHYFQCVSREDPDTLSPDWLGLDEIHVAMAALSRQQFKDTVQLLVDRGHRLDRLSKTGTNVFHLMAFNPDIGKSEYVFVCNLFRTLHGKRKLVTYLNSSIRGDPNSMKWKLIRFGWRSIISFIYRMNLHRNSKYCNFFIMSALGIMAPPATLVVTCKAAGSFEKIEALIENGANLDVKNSWGLDTFAVAKICGRPWSRELRNIVEKKRNAS